MTKNLARAQLELDLVRLQLDLWKAGKAIVARQTNSEKAALMEIALNRFVSALGGGALGDKTSLAELRRNIRPEHGSLYRRVVELCEWHEQHGALDGGMVFFLRDYGDPAFLAVTPEGVGREIDAATDGRGEVNLRDLACRLLIRAKAVPPKPHESREKYEKRIRGALSDAMSKRNVKRARAAPLRSIPTGVGRATSHRVTHESRAASCSRPPRSRRV